MPPASAASVATPLTRLLIQAIADQGGWLPFDRFMALALYAPGLGYYARSSRQFGALPASGSDFITAPEMSPLFGQALARQVAQALKASSSEEVWEFGAGSGELAAQLIDALGPLLRRYTIVDVSGALRARQRERLAAYGDKVQWLDALPDQMRGVVVGNEVLDAMPVQLLHFDGHEWFERGVVWRDDAFVWSDRPTALRPPQTGDESEDWGLDSPPRRLYAPDTTTELHVQAEAFVATLGDRLERGVVFLIDYGFPEAEYYHPQRQGGTLMCHRGHQADTDPLRDVGLKDITAHVNFTGIALAAQDAGFDVIGYTSQARFLMNCGILEWLEGADLRTIANTQKLLTEHEMGELFKVLAFAKACELAPVGFASGDRRHKL